MINLISDTVTLPSQAMKEQMMSAPLGDDVFRGDPTVNSLEQKASNLFGMDEALFCPSGTMTNQIALSIQTNKLDEVICEKGSHIYQYETGGYAYNSGLAINLIDGVFGKITAEQIEAVIKHDYDWLPASKLLVLENTCNRGGGSYYTLDEIKPIKALCKRHGFKLHLDGARLFNALVESGDSTVEYGSIFDSISICLSKGLGAPIGSLLLGNSEAMKRARRTRKVMGGGMRQAGFLAAAGLYALENNVERLKLDHDYARQIAAVLGEASYVESCRPVHTNIIIFDLKKDQTAEEFIAKLNDQGILASAFGKYTVRLVTHMDITPAMYQQVFQVLGKLS